MQEDTNSSLEEKEELQCNNEELVSSSVHLIDDIEESKKIVKDVIIVVISNFIKSLAGVLIGFVILKLMGETNYGYYETYTLYFVYVGLFHFDFINGIYLIYAGKNMKI